MNFWQLVSKQPAGDAAPAITWDQGGTLAYGEMLGRACAVADLLRAKGANAGARVALVAANGPWFFHLMLACARDGLTLVPINARLAPAEIAYILEDCEPAVVVADAASAPLVPPRFGAPLPAESLLQLPPAPHAEHGGGAGPATVLMQMYTSGTTGRPKGAMLTHENVVSIALTGAKELGNFTQDDRALVALPLFHIAAVDWALFSLITGAHIFLLSEVRAEAIVDAMERHALTKTLLVPAVIRMVVGEIEKRGRGVASLRTLCFGASPMPEELLARARAAFPNARMHHVYGMTETTGMFTALDPAEIEANRRLLSCGKVFSTGELRVLDASGAPVAPGEVGHIVYRGPQTMLGYWRNEAATRETIVDGWLRTGDLGTVDAEGFLYVLDRSKDMVKSGGENVYPAEVENALLGHPAIADLAVIGLPDEQWGEIVTAVIVPRGEGPLQLDDLRAYARDRLAAFKLPRRLILVHQLPRNASGKVQKHVLRQVLGPQRP